MARIRTTHAGSLPRPPALVALLARQAAGEGVDPDLLAAEAGAAVRAVVARQVATGIDVVNNGEAPRESFFTYVRTRMSGFGGSTTRRPMADLTGYPDYLALLNRAAFADQSVSLLTPPAAIGAVRYVDHRAIEDECAELAAVLATSGRGPADAFVSAPSPGIIAAAMEDRHYGSLRRYLEALGEALAVEYAAIAAAGFAVQIDAPDLAMERHTLFQDRPLADFLAFARDVVEVTRAALHGIPPEQVRLHVCWGNYEGPHDRDVDFADIRDVVFALGAGTLLLSMANPRHGHEWRVLAERGVPDGVTICAGVIDTTTNYIEHPDLVAERLRNVVAAVGDPARVMAGTDCGFETSAGFGGVTAEVAWAKLAAMVEGARRASAG